MSVRIERYHSDFEKEWNAFISSARNGLFLFQRSFMDYHADRFNDHSLMAFKNGKLIAVLPANVSEDVLFTHQGLTFGGWIVNNSVGAQHMLDLFEALLAALRDEKIIHKIIYKAIPSIFSRQFTAEDSYVLYRLGAQLIRRDLNSVINLRDPLPIDSGRKDNLRKAKREEVIARYSDDFETYFALLSDSLSKHNTRPVHSVSELTRLALAHPENIKLLASYRSNQMLAGIVVFDYGQVVHTQYMSSSSEGRNIGALDMAIFTLINEFIGKKDYLSFGISTEDNGKRLNEGLIRQKEGFGARSIVHEFYELHLDAQ